MIYSLNIGVQECLCEILRQKTLQSPFLLLITENISLKQPSQATVLLFTIIVVLPTSTLTRGDSLVFLSAMEKYQPIPGELGLLT